jgi:hypothetical protein
VPAVAAGGFLGDDLGGDGLPGGAEPPLCGGAALGVAGLVALALVG